MRLMPLVAVAYLTFASVPALAQEWIEYVSRDDLFTVNFPAEPDVQHITYATEYGLTLPARMYRSGSGGSRYSVTVVDYAPAEKTHAERSKACTGYPDTCGNRWRAEIRGAMEYAALAFMQRDARMTQYAYANTDLIEGRRLQMLNADKSRTFAAIHLHQNRLYIIEGTVPANGPPPALFQQSIGFVDEEGRRVRYQNIYSNAYDAPPRVPR